MGTPLDYVRLMRPLNAAMAAWAVLIGAAVAIPIWGYQDFPWPDVAAAMAAAFLILAFGNVANDIADREVDRTAHPERPLPAGRISVGAAAAFATLLGNVGLLLALLAGGWLLFLIALVNALLLLLYAAAAKGWPVIGNLVVAWLVASAFHFGALTTSAWSSLGNWGSLTGFALMALLATLARENAKGLQDAPHDSDRHTLARIAPRSALAMTLLATAAACVLAVWMARDITHPWWLDRPVTWDGVGSGAIEFGLHDRHLALWRWGVLASVPVFVAGAAATLRSPALGQRLLKAAMLVAMLGYTWGALLAFQGN